MSVPECVPRRQRYKAVEHFFRRLAFNLGNTPSQTEVKIISCIPIDVTDLQQRILSLEKQLDDALKCRPPSKCCSKPPSCVHTALCSSNFKTSSSLINNKTETIIAGTESAEGTSKADRNVTSVNPSKEVLNEKKAPTDANCFDKTINNTEHSNKGSVFKKKKKENVRKGKQHLVYYAQTSDNTSPFVIKENKKPPKEKANLSRSFVADIVQKQYQPGIVLSDFSRFSSPVCRDVQSNCDGPCPYESDICSCLYGDFQNTDLNRPPQHVAYNQVYQTAPDYNLSSNNTFYDDTLYDLIPVKETSDSNKTRKTNVIKTFEREHNYVTKFKNEPTMLCWPDKIHQKRKTQLHTYHTVPPHRVNHARKAMRKEKLMKKMNLKRDKPPYMPQTSTESYNSCVFECGNFYAKNNNTTNLGLLPINPLTPQNNADSIALQKNTNMECQTIVAGDERGIKTIPEIGLPSETDTTENTLNQIKSILQTVLNEVKNVPHATKDAVVQKGLSQNHMNIGSNLLNNYSCSPYNMQQQMPSCSRQMPLNNSFVPLTCPPFQCLQNYPIFIKNTARHNMYPNYQNPNFKLPHLPNSKHITSAATNTEGIDQKRSPVTEKLIKDIYKSIELNIRSHENAKSNNASNDQSDGGINVIAGLRNSGDKPIINLNKKCTSDPKHTAFNRFLVNTRPAITSTSESAQTKSVVTSNEMRLQSTPEFTETEIEKDDDVEDDDVEDETESDDSDSESEEESTESEFEDSDSTVISIKQNKKLTESASFSQSPTKEKPKSLFGKMFKSVFKHREKNRKNLEQQLAIREYNESESDSDDYQTVYSQKISHKPTPEPRKSQRAVVHSKIRNATPIYRRKEPSRRSPYLEQEYRRHWTEGVAYDERQSRRYSSEVPYSTETSRGKTHPYNWQSYEARKATFNHNIPHFGNRDMKLNENHIEPHYGNEPPLDLRPKEAQKSSKIKRQTKPNKSVPESGAAKKVIKSPVAWLKKPCIKCSEQWKKFILEN